MGRVAKQGWEKEAIKNFLEGNENRYYQEKLVSLGFMERFSVPKEIPGRGPNPVKYKMTDVGMAYYNGEAAETSVVSAPKLRLVSSLSPEMEKAHNDMTAFCNNPDWTDREIEIIKSGDIPSEMIPACIKMIYPKYNEQIKVVKATLHIQAAIKKHGSWDNFNKFIAKK